MNGGCARWATIQTMSRLSAITGTSLAMVIMSSIILTQLCQLCILICPLIAGLPPTTEPAGGGNGGTSANQTAVYGTLENVDALNSTVTIDGAVYMVGEDFEMNRAEQIGQGDDKKVICVISNGKITQMDLKKDVVKPKLKLIPFNQNIEYKNVQYINKKKQLSINVEYNMSEPYKSILTSTENAPKLFCDKVKLTLTEKGTENLKSRKKCDLENVRFYQRQKCK